MRDASKPSAAPPALAPPHRLKVIVADDDDDSREALQRAVEALGHRCRAACDGLEALALHRAEHADVILSDWRMPELDGIELCKRTRAADADGAYTYFILMTAFGDKRHFLRGMEAGADDYQTKPVDLDELEARLNSAARVVALYDRLATKNQELRRDSQVSFQLARVDPLTQVANRLQMHEDLDILWSRARRYGHGFSIALCDIDWFKSYNDRFGHLAGDDVLRRVARAIREQLRTGDALYRYGGEEFLVVLPEQSLADAAHAMERIRVAVERLAIHAATGTFVTLSVGVAELRPVDESIDAWIARADRALYAAKANGRNRVESDL